MKNALELLKKFSPFIADMIARFFSGKPKFFATLQVVSAVITVIASVLATLKELNYALPASISWIGELTVIVGGITAILMAQLPNPNPAPAEDAPAKP